MLTNFHSSYTAGKTVKFPTESIQYLLPHIMYVSEPTRGNLLQITNDKRCSIKLCIWRKVERFLWRGWMDISTVTVAAQRM